MWLVCYSTFQGYLRNPRGCLLRDHDHAIVLKERVQQVNVKTYCYAYFQKDETEKIVHELLDSGVI